MNIYLVNRYSKNKGPFDIVDSNRKHIIKVGDICLRDTSDGIAFLVVRSSDNIWNACKCVGIGDNGVLSDLGNTLLFSFDGLHKRKGNVSLIRQLSDCYREKVIVDFFQNAIEILEYKKDLWDVSLFSQFFASSQELIERSEKFKPIIIPNSIKYPSVFAKYLNKDLLELLLASLNKGNELKDAYMILRKKNPVLFRAALMTFLTENPTGTIYDKPTFIETLSNLKEAPIVEIQFPIKEERQQNIVATDDDQSYLLSDFSNKELRKLFNRYHKGDKSAFEQLVRVNLKLVAGLARPYKDHGIEYEDLVQEGAIGLIKSIEHFDSNRYVTFPFYAKWWILQSILDYIAKQTNLVRFPLSHLANYRRVNKFINKFEQEKDYLPSITDIEDNTDLDLEIISYLVRLPSDLKDMTCLVEDMDIYESPDSEIEDYEEKDYCRYQAWNYIRVLSKHYRTIIRKYFGIGYTKAESLTTIADEMGYSRERVRQIIAKSIKIMREISPTSIIVGNNFEEHSDDEYYNKIETKIDVLSKYRKSLSGRDKESKLPKNEKYSLETNKPVIRQEVNELKEIKVGDVILYKDKLATVTKIIIYGGISRLVIKYENNVLDDVINDKSKYIVLQSYKSKSVCDAVKELNETQTDNNSAEQKKVPLYNYYIEKISKMRQEVVKGKKDLAKPALLLAIIDGVKDNTIQYNDFVLTQWLEEKYNIILAKYSCGRQLSNLTGIEMPFWHLQSDGFWHLKYPSYLHKEKISPTKKWILDNVEFAKLDDDLWYLLQDDEWRRKMRKFIIDNKLTREVRQFESQRSKEIEFPFLPLQFLQEEKKENKEKYPQGESKYSLVTPLSYLVGHKIITKKQLKHCHKKGLLTIGDVIQKIEKYHLTTDSTRFTKYTIDMWFSIADFAKANGVKGVNVGSTTNKKGVKNANNGKTEYEIEVVYVDIPSADPYTDIEIPQQETDDVEFE